MSERKLDYFPRPTKRLFEVDKEELEKLVWEMPTTEVAKIFGVSDVAIGKRCTLLGVNKPPRGYWQKLRQKKSFVKH
jgi:hypothetical protein